MSRRYPTADASRRARIERMKYATPSFVLVGSGDRAAATFQSCFAVDPAACLKLPYPRILHLLEKGNAPAEFTAPYAPIVSALKSASLVVGYFPTWRDGGAKAEQRSYLDIGALAEHVHVLGGVLVTKPHWKATYSASIGNEIRIPPDADLSAFLGLVDILITDYSSVALDFLALGRPIIIYLEDENEYSAERGLYYNLDELFPGTIYTSQDEVHDAVAIAATREDARPTWLKERLREFWGAPDGIDMDLAAVHRHVSRHA